MKSYNREVSKWGVCDDGSVKGSRRGREKPCVDRYCVRPGAVKAASNRGKTGCERSVWRATLTSPFNSTFARQDLNSATMKMLYAQVLSSLNLDESNSVMDSLFASRLPEIVKEASHACVLGASYSKMAGGDINDRLGKFSGTFILANNNSGSFLYWMS